jgi:hypothetical protein
MADEFVHLVQADEHIAGARARIVKQRELIKRLAAEGHDVRNAESFLFALTGVLSAFESHRLLILNQLRRLA